MVDKIERPAYLAKPYTTEKQALEDERQEKLVNSAKRAAAKIIENSEFIKALNGPLSQYNEVSVNDVRKLVWAAFDFRETLVIKRSDVEFAITNLGGTVTEAKNLWDQMDPNGTGEITYGQFQSNKFMNEFLRTNIKKIESSIEDARIQEIINGTTSAGNRTILDSVQPASTGTLFDYSF